MELAILAVLLIGGGIAARHAGDRWKAAGQVKMSDRKGMRPTGANKSASRVLLLLSGPEDFGAYLKQVGAVLIFAGAMIFLVLGVGLLRR